MNYIVFGKLQQTARYKLDEICETLNKDDILKYVKNPNCSYIELKNGDYYEVRPASKNSRGCKCDVAYIDSTIDQEFIDKVIVYCLTFSKVSPEEQIKYY